MDHSDRDREETTKALADRLRSEPRRGAGVDLQGEPVRLGERDSDGYLVGYVDAAGPAAGRLVDALTLPDGDRRRGELIEAAISGLPDELLEEAMREAALTLALRELGDD